MNLAKAKILLDKINRLHKSISLDEDNVATIEKDLMRDYVKQLYDAFLPEEASVSMPIRPKRVAPKPTYTPPPAYTPPPTPIVRKKVEVVTPPPPPPPPAVEEIRIPVVKVTPPPRVVTPPPPVIESTPAPVAVPKPRQVTPTTVVDPEHADLFEVGIINTKELSEKLGQTRITDLNNAMGLNERIFTVNELFGADNSLYRNVIRDLNGLRSFEEAKAYLSTNVAEKFNWTHKSKRNKAKNFIKLVRRRYV